MDVLSRNQKLYLDEFILIKTRSSKDEFSTGDQTIISCLQIFLDQRSLNSIGQKILMIVAHFGYYSLKLEQLLSKFGSRLVPIQLLTESIGLNRALRYDEAVYWVSAGQQSLVLGGTESV